MCFADGVCDDDPNNNMAWNTSNATKIFDNVIRTPYYRLTQEGTWNDVGSTFRTSNSYPYGRVDLREDFIIEAELNFGDNDAYGSGIAFHISKNRDTYREQYENEMGMQYQDALSVEFDTRFGNINNNEYI